MGSELKGRLVYEYPYFVTHLAPNGFLTVAKECHACFYYGMLANQAIALQGKGPESQTIVYKVGDTPPPWFDALLPNIARSVAIIYGLESPDSFLPYKKEAWAQAKSLGFDIPEIVFRVRPGIIVP